MENTMKKLMFIFLLVISFCKAADPDASWNQAVQNIPDWATSTELNLAYNQIQAIPANLTLLNLEALNLAYNQIKKFDPKRLLEQFPKLDALNLSNNPQLDPRNIQDLIDAADEAGRNIEITADNILPPQAEGHDIKGSED